MTIQYTREQAMDLAQRLAARDLATDLEYVIEQWPEFDQKPYLEQAWKILGDHFDLAAVLAPERRPAATVTYGLELSGADIEGAILPRNVGPFEDRHEAEAWAGRKVRTGSWSVFPMVAP